MKKYTITLTCSIEAESEKEALEYFVKQTIDDLNTGENIEVDDEENEETERFCVKCGKTSGLLEDEDICFTCAKERGRI